MSEVGGKEVTYKHFGQLHYCSKASMSSISISNYGAEIVHMWDFLPFFSRHYTSLVSLMTTTT